MNDEPINISPDTLTEDELRVFKNPALAKVRVFVNGEFYPVARMFGGDGQIVVNPLHAFGVVAFTGKEWTMMSCRPGDVEPIREGRPWLRQ